MFFLLISGSSLQSRPETRLPVLRLHTSMPSGLSSNQYFFLPQRNLAGLSGEMHNGSIPERNYFRTMSR